MIISNDNKGHLKKSTPFHNKHTQKIKKKNKTNKQKKLSQQDKGDICKTHNKRQT